MNEYARQDYTERQFHRVVRERDIYRALSRVWLALALTGWTALIAVAFKAGIALIAVAFKAGIIGT